MQVDVELHTLAKYLMELTMLDYDMVHFAPSQIAAGAFCLALKILDNGEWVSPISNNEHYIGNAVCIETMLQENRPLIVPKLRTPWSKTLW